MKTTNDAQLMLLGARAEGYIKAHLSEKLDRDKVCRALSTNRTTLSRALILRTGRTFKRFVLDERIKLSKELLLAGEQNIGIVAENCGFGDASYFSRIFREYTGMTPAVYVESKYEPSDDVWSYRLDGETLPVLPCVHDCAISRIVSDGEYLSICFDDGISHIRPGAKGLTVRYHLCDPCILAYREYRRERGDNQGYEIGYTQYDDEEEFFKASAELRLFYVNHCIGYNAVMLKLWAYDDPWEILLDFNADNVEYRWDFATFDSEIMRRMEEAGIRLEAGMSDQALEAAQKFFGFIFPKEIAAFLRSCVPVGEYFFDYRDLSDENLEKFKAFRRRIEGSFSFDVENVPYFLRAMEQRYGTNGVDETLDAILADYQNSPNLIPFFAHRCFFDGLNGMPIISFSQPCDLVIYGEHFQDYLEREFCFKSKAHPLYNLPRMKETGVWEACLALGVEPHIAAHVHCGRNRKALEHSKKCGCFYCLRIFLPKEIDRWIDDEQTALCPYCQIDSVIGDASGYSITKEFLKTMEAFWFSPVHEK